MAEWRAEGGKNRAGADRTKPQKAGSEPTNFRNRQAAAAGKALLRTVTEDMELDEWKKSYGAAAGPWAWGAATNAPASCSCRPT